MKSLFLVTLICLLVAEPAMSQTRRKKKSAQTNSRKVRRTRKNSRKAQTTKKSVIVVNEKKAEEKSQFDRFNERLSIIYWSAYTSSPLNSWNLDYASTNSFSDGDGKTCYDCDTIPQNIFNLLIFNYSYAPGKRFTIQPRFSIFLGKNPDPGTASSVVVVEDFLFSWQTRLFASEDGKWSVDFRPGLRLPTSRGSRTDDSGDFGDLTHQPDINFFVNYAPNKEWSFQYNLQNRFYIFEDRYNESRHRIAQYINTNYQLSDKLSIMHYVEYWVQNSGRRVSINNKSTSYKKIWFNTYVGLAYQATDKFNITPLIGAYPDDPNFGLHSSYVGAWLTYLIK